MRYFENCDKLWVQLAILFLQWYNQTVKNPYKQRIFGKTTGEFGTILT